MKVANIEERPDREMRKSRGTGFNKICDIHDWNKPRFRELMSELGEPPGVIHRKSWENIEMIIGLERLGFVNKNAVGLSVGAGHEKALFYFSKHIKKIIGIDLYDKAKWPVEGNPQVIRTPDRFVSFPYRKENLELRVMNALNLEFEDNSFDFVYSLSSIEHFGGHSKAAAAMQEMERVVKKDGIVCIATEYILNDGKHHEFFNKRDLQQYLISSHSMHLIGNEIDFRISSSHIEDYLDFELDALSSTPHIALRYRGVLFTSIILFFSKSESPVLSYSHSMTGQTFEEEYKEKSIDKFLWKYGNRYRRIIKKLPLLNRIAEKQYRRLTSQRESE